ncbi:MAG: TVP38/TMEM64 family protein [Firmicutes bacterium]|nr:TVP38/TMEM64 family protein [Bacillota bacterium]
MDRSKLTKIILTVISLALVAAVSYMLWGIFKMLLTESGRAQFEEKVLSLGAFGWLVILGLNVAQVFLFFFPGEPVEVLSGMCYGAFGGLLIIFAGIFISCAIIFFLVRKVGKSAVSSLIGKEKVERIENSRILRSKTAEKLLLLLFVIPGTPKDFLVYVGAMMPVKPVRFVILSTLLRFPGIVSSTIVGDSFAEGNTALAVTVYAVTLVLSLLLMAYYSKKDGVKEILELNRHAPAGGTQEYEDDEEDER